MNKKTQQIVGALAILGLGYWAYTKYGKKKSFANLTAPSNYIAGVDKDGKPCSCCNADCRHPDQWKRKIL